MARRNIALKNKLKRHINIYINILIEFLPAFLTDDQSIFCVELFIGRIIYIIW